MPRPLAWILLLAVVCWSGSIVRGGFAYDDQEVLTGNPVVAGDVPVSRAFTQDYWAHIDPAGHYRPLATLSLRLDKALFGEVSTGYHATNVVLHLIVCALAGLLFSALWGASAGTSGGAKTLRGTPDSATATTAGFAESGPTTDGMERAGWIGLALFAVHPALADSVAWISGRTSMLSALGGLAAALVIALRAGAGTAAVASAIGVLASLLGKEDGVLFAPLCVLLALRHSWRAALASAAGCALAIGAYAWMRHAAIDQWLPAAPHAPLAGAPLEARVRASGGALVEGLRVAAMPFGYPPQYAADAFAQTWRVTAALAWGALALLGAGGAWFLAHGPSRAARIAGASALLVLGAILPHMQLRPSGVLFAPRFLYLPLLFGAPLVGGAWQMLRRGLLAGPRRGRIAGALVLAACCALAWSRAGVYASRGSFWQACLEHRSEDAALWNALGNARNSYGKRASARKAWNQALSLDPNYSRALNNLGSSYIEEVDFETAEQYLRRATLAGPRNPAAYANLGGLLLRTDRPEEAARQYERAVALAPGRGALWRGLARARQRSGDLLGAREAVERALYLDPADASAARLLEALRR